MNDLYEALKILKESHILVEFLDTMLSRDQLLRRLKSVKPSFEPKSDILKNEGNRRALITLVPTFLDGTGMGQRDFNEFLQKYGWNLIGFTNKQIILAPIRHIGNFKNKRKTSELYKTVLERVKGWYIRFTDDPPYFIKKYGFRSAKGRNLPSNDPNVRTKERYFNQERVFLYSFENAIRDLGDAAEPKEIIQKIAGVIDNGRGYGDYAYLVKLNPSAKFYTDPEYSGSKELANSAGYVNTSIPPSQIKVAIPISRDVLGDVLDNIGLDDLYAYSKLQDPDPDSEDSIEIRNMAKSNDTFDPYEDAEPDDTFKEMQHILSDYDKDKIMIIEPSEENGVKLFLENIRIPEEGVGFYLNFEGDSMGYHKYRLRVSDDGSHAELAVYTISGYRLFRESEIRYSNELKRLLSDRRTVELAKKIDDLYSDKSEFDPRTRKSRNRARNWAQWK